METRLAFSTKLGSFFRIVVRQRSRKRRQLLAAFRFKTGPPAPSPIGRKGWIKPAAIAFGDFHRSGPLSNFRPVGRVEDLNRSPQRYLYLLMLYKKKTYILLKVCSFSVKRLFCFVKGLPRTVLLICGLFVVFADDLGATAWWFMCKSAHVDSSYK